MASPMVLPSNVFSNVHLWASISLRMIAADFARLIFYFILFYFISFANRQGHRNSLRQLLRARN